MKQLVTNLQSNPLYVIGKTSEPYKYGSYVRDSSGSQTKTIPSVTRERHRITRTIEQPVHAGLSMRPIFYDIGTRFGARLRDLRHSQNMTQIDMAVNFGIDRSYISDLECGKKGVSLATLEVIALGFHIPLADLLRDL